MKRERIAVTGMSCSGCEQNVENALLTLDSVSRADADCQGDTVEVVVGESVTDDELHAAIERAGYDVAI